MRELKIGVEYKSPFGYGFADGEFQSKLNNTFSFPCTMLMTDIQLIRYFNIDKDFYIDTLISFGAYQNASREFPRLFFKKEEDAKRVLIEFFEPLSMMKKLTEVS